MTPDPPAEGPRYQNLGQVLSPVSPKPLHYPIPSDIPVLENQMDPVFNDTSTHMGQSHHYQPDVHHGQATYDTPYANYAAQGTVSNGRSGQMEANVRADGDDGYAVSGHEAQGLSNQDMTTFQDRAPANYSNTAAPSEAAARLEEDGVSSSAPVPKPYGAFAQDSSQESAAQAAHHQGNAATEPSHDRETHEGTRNGDTGGVDYQALLDNITANASAGAQEESTTNGIASPTSHSHVHTPADLVSPTSASAGPASLPPRPPPQEQPAIHPNYTHSSDIRAYHPHSQNSAVQSTASQHGTPYRPTASANFPAPLMHAGANGLPPPPPASFQQVSPVPVNDQPQSPSRADYRQRESLHGRDTSNEANGSVSDNREARWSSDVQKKYDDFLEQERRHVNDGQWDKFPPNSRLFIGNLPTELVTKRDIFHIFHKHGTLAQISIKQAYGFVQFLEANACYRALQTEQAGTIRGRKMHLEISKPQKNTRNADNKAGSQRTRSPDYNRGGNAPAGVDRYVSGPSRGNNRGQQGGRNNGGRGRDDYRPGRSPSPRGFRGGRGSRDWSPDRYDGRRRSRSRSPYSRGGRYRSPSPKRDYDDDLPLPRRLPHAVPDVQIIFIGWVDRAFKDAGVSCDVLIMSPRLSEPAVIRRQILEGVQAVTRLSLKSQQSAKIPLQVFDRRAGVDNVRFEEYDDLDPTICAQLVIRAKQANAAPAQASYGVPPSNGYGSAPQAQYGYQSMQPAVPPQQAPQPLANAAPNLSNLITSLDGAGLQRLLGAMQSPQTPSQPQHQQQQPPPPSANLLPDLARLLGNAGGAQAFQGQQPHYQPQLQQPVQQADTYAALRSNPALAGLLGGQQQAPPTRQEPPPPGQQLYQQPAPDMAKILAQLGNYRR
ncbi:hypothetical protein BJ546DRAFT_1025037 [Cryomyces antarcticus]